MNMATMNSNAGGPVGGAMMMMNNGSPAVMGGADGGETTRSTLNTYIYEYLLKNGHYEIARSASRDDKFVYRHGPKVSPNRRKEGDMNGDSDGMDMDLRDDVPNDLPRSEGWDGSNGNGFLLEWFSIFSDLYSVHRQSTKSNGIANPAAAQYLSHEKTNQRLRENIHSQTINRAGMNQAMMQRMNGAMNGNMQGKFTPQQMQAMQQQKRMAMQQQQMREGQGDGEMNGVRPGTPAAGDDGGSPSKRPRIDGGQPAFNNGMMPNGRPGGVPGAQNQGMMIQSGFNPNMNPQFQRNGAMPPKGMPAGMQNGMMNMANTGSPMMQGMSQFPEGMQIDYMQQRNMAQGQPGMQQGGGAQSGNHALQDYQMQLMLLEQQNKKRLMMARQEQHENNPGQGGPMAGVNMQPTGMSPSGSRTGTSPNPGEMKRTPGMGGMPGSPSAGEAMAGRSPAGMNFMGNMQGQDFNPGMFMGKDGPMNMSGAPMRAPTSADMNAIRAQQAGRPGQFPGGQPMQQQGSQAGQMGGPGQREMPPPQAPAGANAGRGAAGASPAANAPPTPSQTNKANPKGKKANAKNDEKRQRPAKKGSQAAASDDNPPATPTQPSTPITPNQAGVNQANKAQPGIPQGNQNQQNQGMQMNQPMQQNDLSFTNFTDAGAGDQQQFNLDFSTLENADVLENFDFDSFLNTSADDAFNVDIGGDFSGDFGMGGDQ